MNINLKDIAVKLSKIKNSLNLDYEVLMCYRKDESPEDVLKEVYKQALELEFLIGKENK